jgi:hypothetical protein
MTVRAALAATITLAALSLAPARARANPTSRGPSSPGDGAPYRASEAEDTRPSLLGGESPQTEGPSTLPPQQQPLPVPFPVPNPIVAGWRDDAFFISDRGRDWFISPGARLQVDFHMFNPHTLSDERSAGGVSTPSLLRTGVQIRRARVELAGGVFSFLTWRVGAELTDNGPQTAADMHVNLRLHPVVNVQIGQFDAPFTMENRTSDRYLDFIERSLTVRALGVPTGKEIGLMLWGEDRLHRAYWSVGVFNGGGPDRFTPSNQVEAAARFFFHPFMMSHRRGIGRQFQVGLSGRLAHRSLGGHSPYPAMDTPAGYTLFSPALAPDLTLVQSGRQWAVAAELDLPLDRFDLRGEFVYVRNHTGEVAAALDGALARDPVRLGALEGFGFYVQAAYWLIGLPPSAVRPEHNDTMARPGYQDPPTVRVDRAQALRAPLGLQAVARFDTVQMAYRGASRDARGGGDSGASGRYKVLAAEVGLNLWVTRHLRVLLNYRHYWFPEQPWEVTADANHMRGPTGHPSSYGEFSVRAAINL